MEAGNQPECPRCKRPLREVVRDERDVLECAGGCGYVFVLGKNISISVHPCDVEPWNMFRLLINEPANMSIDKIAARYNEAKASRWVNIGEGVLPEHKQLVLFANPGHLPRVGWRQKRTGFHRIRLQAGCWEMPRGAIGVGKFWTPCPPLPWSVQAESVEVEHE